MSQLRYGMPVHSYRFYCYWDSRSSYRNATTAAEEDWTAGGRLGAAWNGKRETGAQMLELAVWGYQDDESARGALVQQMSKIVRAEK